MRRWKPSRQARQSGELKGGGPLPHPLPLWTRRLKALIVDLFMLYVPLLYIEGYLYFGTLASFRESVGGPLIATAIFLVVSALFVMRTGQTPGKRAYNLAVVDAQSGENLSFLRALWRTAALMFSAAILVGGLLPLWRRDRRALHDLLAGSKVVDKA